MIKTTRSNFDNLSLLQFRFAKVDNRAGDSHPKYWNAAGKKEKSTKNKEN